MPRPDRGDLLVPALVLAGLALKLSFLGRNELSHDEPFTVVMAFRDLPDLFSQLREENNPPLWYLMMHGWVRLVPMDPAWYRVPAAVCSALAVWPFLLLARDLAGPRVAIIAALLFTFSEVHYGLAHEMRAYALLTLLSITALWQLWRAAQGAPRAWLWLGLVQGAMLLTHFLGWVVLGIEVLLMTALPSFRPAWKGWVRSVLLSALLFAPYAGTFLHRTTVAVTRGTWLGPPGSEDLYNVLWGWCNQPVVVVLSLLVVCAAMLLTRPPDLPLRVGLLWSIVPLLGLFVLSHWVPLFLDRYLVLLAPGFSLLLAAAAVRVRLPERWTLLPGSVLVFAMALTFRPWRTNGLHPSNVVERAGSWRGDGGVWVHPFWYTDTYAWHLDRTLVAHPARLAAELARRGVHPMMPPWRPPVDADTLVYIHAGRTEQASVMEDLVLLRTHYAAHDSVEADHGVWVHRFSRP